MPIFSLMTEQNYPITPPRKLVQQWSKKGYGLPDTIFFEYVANCSAQWGFDQAKADIERERQEAADQELEACCEWNNDYRNGLGKQLRAARRPKPPSLKVEALIHFESYAATFETAGGDSDLILRALESIPDPS